jgi:UDP-2,3-diacylglucosamine pyrophosphatase LpxH
LGGAAPASPENPEDRGFRINTHTADLAEFVQTLAAKPPKVELIINGDTVDFLAEREWSAPYWRPFTADPEAASRKLEAIATREKPFFDALADFLERGHRLTILLGNHDVEMALPGVRRTLERILRVQGSSDYTFIGNGEAYIVGDALIEHGNRYDKFNVIDYDSLRRLCSLQSRRQPTPEKYEFSIPAGSFMVSQVINPIKEDYRFVDLLKPEDGAVVPLLLALEPGFRNLIAKALKFNAAANEHKLAAAAMPSYGGDISSFSTEDMEYGSDISAGPAAPAASSEEAGLRQTLQETLGTGAGHFLDATAADPADDDGYGSIGSDISTMDVIDRSLGFFKLLTGSGTAVDKRLPAVLQAVRALQTDQTFNKEVETAREYIDSARELARTGGFRFVIFGHTHLPKKVALDEPGAIYLNTGTWVDLMRFPTSILSGAPDEALSGLREFVGDLKSGSLRRWILYTPTFARLDLDDSDRLLNADIYTYTGPASV